MANNETSNAEDHSEPAEEVAPEALEAVEAGAQEAEALKAEIAALKDQLLRAVAETENVRRRTAREREETAKYAITAFARELLPVADNLRRALEAVDGEARKDSRFAGLIEGIEMTERELLGVLERHGIRKIEPLGEKFDHNYHQAMFEVTETDQPSGTVVQVMQPGYLIAERLLRPALVGVAKRPRSEPVAHVDAEA